jgi:hypothetical protein
MNLSGEFRRFYRKKASARHTAQLCLAERKQLFLLNFMAHVRKNTVESTVKSLRCDETV